MRILLAFMITVFIYMFLIWLYWIQFRDIRVVKQESTDDHIIKIDIRAISTIKPINKPIKSTKPIKSVKPSIKDKEIIPSTIKKNKKKNITKKNKVKITKKVIVEKKRKKKRKNRKKVTKEKNNKKNSKMISESDMIYIPDPIMSNESFSSPVEPVHNSINHKIKPSPRIQKLYGKDFNNFSTVQQKFIVDHLDSIHRITQNRLTQRGYPSGAIAARTGQEGTNIVSFNLHPNGDISNLYLKRKVGYRALDNNTLETIRSAYKDYPYPKEVTKIIFYVEYSIFGY